MYRTLVGLWGDHAVEVDADLGGDAESTRGGDWLGIYSGGLE